MSFIPITVLPPAPSRSDPANFNDKADSFVGALSLFVTELNAGGAEINAMAAQIAIDAAATTSDVAETNNNVVATSDNVNYSAEWAANNEDVPVSVAAGGDGSTTFSSKHYDAKAKANYQGTVAMAAATAAAAGLPSMVGKAGQALIVQPNETVADWGVAYAGTLNSQTFTSSGTWTRPSGANYCYIIAVAGGGGGAASASNQYSASGGGAGGEVFEGFIPVTGDLSIAIGDGGLGGTTDSESGSNGGHTVISGGASLLLRGGGPGAALGATNPDGNLGNGGGCGRKSSSLYCWGGGGAGARSHGGDVYGILTTLMTSLSQDTGGFFKGGAATEKSSFSVFPGRGGAGLKGLGGGGNGGSCFGIDVSGNVDGGGEGGLESAGGDATQNTGGGGGGAASQTGTVYKGGDGAKGVVTIYWWT